MARKRLYFVSGLIIGLISCIIGLMVFFGTSSQAASENVIDVAATVLPSQLPAPTATPLAPTDSTNQTDLGLPAITPRLPSVNAATATFTQLDVEQYVKTTPRFGKISSSTQITVVKVQFMLSREVGALLGGVSTGTRDDKLLCYVEIQGSFSHSTPYNKAITRDKAQLIFDALTGNLLIAGYN